MPGSTKISRAKGKLVLENKGTILDELLELVREYDRWRRIGHRPSCMALHSIEYKIVACLIDGKELSAELKKAYAYLKRCPICRQVIRETVEYFKDRKVK